MALTFVVNQGLEVGWPLACALARRGARVAWLGDSGEPAAGVRPAEPRRFAARFESRAAVKDALSAAAGELGAPDQVVVSALPLEGLRATDLQHLDPAVWRVACSGAMKSLLYVLQACHAHMAGRGGSVVVVGPTLALAGAPGLVALCTALEGQRGLVKATARQWGRLGIRLNWLAAAPRALSAEFDALPLPSKPDAVPVALGTAPPLADGAVPLIEFLAGEGGRRMTGATLLVDGGEWMVP